MLELLDELDRLGGRVLVLAVDAGAGLQELAAVLIKQAIGIEKGSGEPNRTKVGTITQAQVREIAERKMADLNANDVDQAAKIIEGTARSMGVTVA